MAHWRDPFAPTALDLWERRQREIEERLARGRPITAEQKAERQRVIDAVNAERQAQGLPPLPTLEERAERAKPEPKPRPKARRAKPKPSTRKAWALEQLLGLIKAGKPKPQQTVLNRWQTKYGRFRDRDARPAPSTQPSPLEGRGRGRNRSRKKIGHLS
jgi:hypothetical protein